VGGLLASLDLHRLDYNAEPSRVARGGGPSSMGGVSFCSRSPPSGIAAPSRVTKGGGTAGEGGGAGGDADDVAIFRRRVLFASALDFRPFLRLSPPLLVCLTFRRVRPLAVGRLLGFVSSRYKTLILTICALLSLSVHMPKGTSQRARRDQSCTSRRHESSRSTSAPSARPPGASEPTGAPRQ